MNNRTSKICTAQLLHLLSEIYIMLATTINIFDKKGLAKIVQGHLTVKCFMIVVKFSSMRTVLLTSAKVCTLTSLDR